MLTCIPKNQFSIIFIRFSKTQKFKGQIFFTETFLRKYERTISANSFFQEIHVNKVGRSN